MTSLWSLSTPAITDRLRRPNLDASATATTSWETSIISAFSCASRTSGVITPISGSRLSTPRKRRSAWRLRSTCSACGPTSEDETCRSSPPIMITRTFDKVERIEATLSAFVMTVSERRRSAPMRLAMAAVVVPESRMIVSSSRIIRAAASAIRSFSSRCSACLTTIGWSSASSRRSAPPCERITPPASASASRSPRIVTGETPKRAASSRTVARSRDSMSSLIRERRSSRKSAGRTAGERRALPSRRVGFSFDFVRLRMLSSYSRLRAQPLSRTRGRDTAARMRSGNPDRR